MRVTHAHTCACANYTHYSTSPSLGQPRSVQREKGKVRRRGGGGGTCLREAGPGPTNTKIPVFKRQSAPLISLIPYPQPLSLSLARSVDLYSNAPKIAHLGSALRGEEDANHRRSLNRSTFQHPQQIMLPSARMAPMWFITDSRIYIEYTSPWEMTLQKYSLSKSRPKK